MKKNLFLLSLTLTLNSFGQCVPDITSSLIARYDFTGNANDGVGSFNGTVNNASLSTDRFSNPNNCYSFNGINSSISFGSNTPMSQLYNDFTINFWINPQSDGMIMGSYDWGYYVNISSHKMTYAFVSAGAVWEYSTSNFNLVYNTWYMVTFTRQSNQTKVYINGFLDQTYSSLPSYAVPSTNNSYFIGGDIVDNNQYFNGLLDDIKYYNRSLTVCDISGLYNISTVNIKELNTLPIDIYSNSNSIFIQNETKIENVNIDVFNLSGQLIYSSLLQSSKIDLNVPNGLYIVKLSKYNKYITKKIIINN